MKKTLLLIGIVTWVLILVLVVAAIAGGVFTGGFTMANRDYNENELKEQYIELPGISQITLETDSMNIELYATSEAQMRVRQYGNRNVAPEELFTVAQNGGSVQIRVKHLIRIFSLGTGLNERLVVDIPAAWLGNLNASASSGRVRVNDTFAWQNASLSTSSGNIVIERALTAESLDLHVNSGGIRVHEALTVEDLFSADSSSGNIRIEAPVRAKELYARANSGAIVFDEVAVEQFELRASSGNITAAGISGGGSVRVNSGSINIGLREPLNNVDLQASSGSIRVNVDQNLAFSFEGRCSSGSIRANFPLDKNDKGSRAWATVGLNPTASISAEANSGSIHINQQ